VPNAHGAGPATTGPARRARRGARLALALATTLVVACTATRAASAQTTITVSAVTPAGGALTVPTEAQYDANVKAAIQFNWSVTSCKAATGTTCQFQIRGSAATFNGRPVSDMEWSTNNSTWTVMTTTYADGPTIARNAAGSGTVYLRLRVRWDAYTSGTTFTPAIDFRVRQ